MKGILPLVFIAIALGLFFFQVSPQYAVVKELRVESKQYDEALRIAQELKQLQSELAQKLSSFSVTDLDKLEKFLPERLDSVRIIFDIDGIASKHNIRINDPKVSESPASRGVVNTVKQTYSTVNVSFNFNSTYPEAVIFLKDVERSLRLFDSVAVSIKPAEKKSVGGPYSFAVVLNTYWIKE